MLKQTIDDLMTQVQVYASAWASVDGPFDNGNMLGLAEEEKFALREMLEDAVSGSEDLQEQLNEIATGLIKWHQNRLDIFDKVLDSSIDEIRLEPANGKTTVLEGDKALGFKMGVAVARGWIAKFPLSITPNESGDGEDL